MSEPSHFRWPSVEGFRIADALIMSATVSGNTNTPPIMIAETRWIWPGNLADTRWRMPPCRLLLAVSFSLLATAAAGQPAGEPSATSPLYAERAARLYEVFEALVLLVFVGVGP